MNKPAPPLTLPIDVVPVAHPVIGYSDIQLVRLDRTRAGIVGDRTLCDLPLAVEWRLTPPGVRPVCRGCLAALEKEAKP